MKKPYSAACERNRDPILGVLQHLLVRPARVLEVGSGTGQHAVYFAAALPHLTWQTSDLPENHPGIQAWLHETGLPNVLPPLALDVGAPAWPDGPYEVVFTANTCHIMSWEQVGHLVDGVSRVLMKDGMLCIYGPFNYGGQYTSESNAAFDASLKIQGTHMGIRNFEDVNELAAAKGFVLVNDFDMPANNRFLVWRKA